MRWGLSVLLVAFPLVAFAGETPVNADGVWSCLTDPHQSTIYMSGVFEMARKSSGGPNGSAQGSEVQTAFEQMIASKYGVKTWATCSMAYAGPNVLAKLQSDQKSYVAQLQHAGNSVVETGWTYSAAAASLPYLCYGIAANGPDGHVYNTFHITQILAVNGASADTISEAWTAHLGSLYPATAVQLHVCAVVQADLDKAKATRQSWIDKYKNQLRIVEDNWTFGGGIMTATNATPPRVAAPVVPKPPVDDDDASPPATAATHPPTSAPQHPAPTAALPQNTAAAPPPPKVVAYICQTGYYTPPPNRHFTRYQSDIVHSTNDVKTVTSAWRAYLTSTYGLTGPLGGTCLVAGPSADSILAGWAKQRAGQQVEDVKVDWHG